MEKSTCICTNLRQAALATTAFYDAALAPAGLKVTMFRLLRRIDEAPDITITALAEMVSLDRSTLGRNVRVLERQGFVSLSPGEDERSRTIALSDAGKTALSAAVPLWQGAQVKLQESLGPDHEALMQSLVRISDLTQQGKGDHHAD